MRLPRLHANSVAYASTSFGFALMGSVFNFYYVKIFLNRYHISEPWFQFAQFLYMVWNAINDPLFGYCQDNCDMKITKSRRHSILYGAPFFALSFLLPWFPFGDYSVIGNTLVGVHLVLSLCFWDTLLTFVLLAQCCLFTEMSQKHEDRLRLVRYSQVASLFGYTSVFFCEHFSDHLAHYHVFQGITVVIAIIAFLTMTYTGKNCHTEYDLQSGGVHGKRAESQANEKNGVEQEAGIVTLTLQIARQRNFICFVIMNFCQIFYSIYLANFMAIICDRLIPKEILPSTARSIFYGFTMVAPQLILIFCTPVIARYGSYQVINTGFLVQIALGLLTYLMCGILQMPLFLIVFFIVASTIVHASFSLFNMPLSDIIDADKQLYQRRHPLSSMVFGTNALITKPAVSLAPMIAVNILNRYGYEEFKLGKLKDPEALQQLDGAMLMLTCAVPVIVSFIQYIVWARYTLRNSHDVIGKYTEAE